MIEGRTILRITSGKHLNELLEKPAGICGKFLEILLRGFLQKYS